MRYRKNSNRNKVGQRTRNYIAYDAARTLQARARGRIRRKVAAERRSAETSYPDAQSRNMGTGPEDISFSTPRSHTGRPVMVGEIGSAQRRLRGANGALPAETRTAPFASMNNGIVSVNNPGAAHLRVVNIAHKKGNRITYTNTDGRKHVVTITTVHPRRVRGQNYTIVMPNGGNRLVESKNLSLNMSALNQLEVDDVRAWLRARNATRNASRPPKLQPTPPVNGRPKLNRFYFTNAGSLVRPIPGKSWIQVMDVQPLRNIVHRDPYNNILDIFKNMVSTSQTTTPFTHGLPGKSID